MRKDESGCESSDENLGEIDDSNFQQMTSAREFIDENMTTTADAMGLSVNQTFRYTCGVVQALGVSLDELILLASTIYRARKLNRKKIKDRIQGSFSVSCKEYLYPWE